MSEQAAQQGHAAIQGSAGPRIQNGRASSRSSIIGIGLAGALLTAAAIGGVVMMSGSASTPVATQVAVVSAPAVVAPAYVAPVAAPAYVAPVTVAAPVTNFAPPVTAPAPVQSFAGLPGPAQSAPALNVPGQCQIGQVQQLSINLSATKRKEIGNVIRVHSGSYVSPPIVLTRFVQTVTFPAPPGSINSARIMIEQSRDGGSTFDDEANGITVVYDSDVDAHRDIVLLRWSTPRC